MSKMTTQIDRLALLMASFVNVYKIQNGKLALRKKNFNITELVRTIVSDFQYTTKSHSLEYKSCKEAVLFADKERIAQVLVNLISNAIKYSPASDKVIITCSKNQNNIIISVQDFGIGIPKDEQVKIFDRFFRVKGKKKNGISGLGLGLYISREIVNRHKGKIWVVSIEGKGSTFRFSLPIKQNVTRK